MSQAEWPSRVAQVVATEVRRYREARKMSAQQLAERCAKLGMEIPRAVLANLENGRRSTVTLAELLVLARALDVPPLQLVFPMGRLEEIEALPGQIRSTWTAAKWFTGEDSESGPVRPVDLFRTHDRHERAELEAEVRAAENNGNAEMWARAQDRELDALLSIRQSMRRNGLVPPPLRSALARVETARMPSVVAAIVTSPKGVLVGRRNDGTPPWTFIAGEVEPGEQPEDAAVREVKEETGCEIRTREEIGRRVHPKTGRAMIYLAATPERSTKLIVGDEAELAEVKWASLAEAEELLPDMFDPVRDYLARTLGGDR